MNTQAAQNAISAFALAQVGKAYDYRGLFGFIARKDLDRAGKWFCSELVTAAFFAAQIPLVRDYPHKIAPSDLKRSPLLNFFAMGYTRTGSTVPMPGDAEIRVALYRGTSCISRWIQWKTWSDYSHAALILPDNTVIESLAGEGVIHHPHVSQFHNNNTCVEVYNVNWSAALLCRSFNPEGTISAQDYLKD